MTVGAGSTRLTVLVTDGEQRSALAAVRALGGAGHRVIVASARARPLSAASRYAAHVIQTAEPLRHPETFIDQLSSAVRRWNVDVVLPMTDDSMLASLAARTQLEPAVIPFGDLESYASVSNKQAVLAAAPMFGISVPAQRTLCREHLHQFTAEGLSYPIVIKPARTVGEHNGQRQRFGVQYASDARELMRIVHGSDPAAFPLLLQQRIVGPGVGIFLLVWNDETIAAFSHRRLREKPPSGGVSVYRESIAADPELVARSKALLQHFGWCGVAMIEYKIDAATGAPFLMEINGRFWGSLQLAMDAGVDFPNLLLAAAVKGEQPSVSSYRIGVRSRWWWGDVDQLITRLRRSPSALALPPDSPTRWQAVRDFIRFWDPRDRNEILRLNDPWPFVRESVDWLRRR
jgi:predicted ATP-grasp superfamily ATP-dependent carboligase